MVIIVPANNKGGVGKTKCAMLLAEYFAKVKQKKTLAIDFDPQCNFSQLNIKMEIDPTYTEGMVPPLHPDFDPNEADSEGWDGRSSIADIFFGQPIMPYPTKIPNLDIAPGNASKLLQAEAVRRNEIQEKVHKQLNILLSSNELKSEYEVVIIDTAPSKGPLTVSAVRAATHMYIPAIMEEQPIRGIYGMMQLWMQEAASRSKDNPLNFIGILPNKFDARKSLHVQLLESLKNNESMGKYIMPVTLGDRVIFAEHDAENPEPDSIFDLPETNKARQETLAFCQFIEKRVFLS